MGIIPDCLMLPWVVCCLMAPIDYFMGIFVGVCIGLVGVALYFV